MPFSPSPRRFGAFLRSSEALGDRPLAPQLLRLRQQRLLGRRGGAKATRLGPELLLRLGRQRRPLLTAFHSYERHIMWSSFNV